MTAVDSPAFPSALSHSLQLKIESLLGEVNAGLAPVPPECRAEFVDEMRVHLGAMLTARMADGMNETDAWAATHAAFGDGGEIGRDLAQEWILKPRIETEGAPLSGREKTFSAGIVVIIWGWMLAFVLWAYPFLHARNLLWVFYFFCLMMALIGFFLGKQKETKIKTNQGMIRTSALLWMYLVFNCVKAGIEPLQSAWNFQMSRAWDIGICVFNLLFIVAIVVAVVRERRELNTVRPWRTVPGYQQNPMAVEQRFRMGLPLGIGIALLSVPIIGLAVGMQLWQVGIVTAGLCMFFGMVAIIVRLVFKIS